MTKGRPKPSGTSRSACTMGRPWSSSGTSGCGKTTLLKMTNRLIDVTSGSIQIDGEDISEIRPTALRRRIFFRWIRVISSVTLAAG
jgi:ABC-type proline/glycine betaine transport system ATPase subunit